MRKQEVDLTLYYEDEAISDLLERLQPDLKAYMDFGKVKGTRFETSEPFPYGGFSVYSSKKSFNSDFRALLDILKVYSSSITRVDKTSRFAGKDLLEVSLYIE